MFYYAFNIIIIIFKKNYVVKLSDLNSFSGMLGSVMDVLQTLLFNILKCRIVDQLENLVPFKTLKIKNTNIDYCLSWWYILNGMPRDRAYDGVHSTLNSATAKCLTSLTVRLITKSGELSLPRRQFSDP